ncbi:MAG: hypothetical protein A2W91_05955 [Bacteroidetes bacterium GWF2_38_335]|nr:MAG: hypothetical protein A2W91_05955 [Bacteroidetes bacterium GWF2_38_335]OFY81618.1 MAG: hypothetical protein A2281_11750 [Bacteroidetes bacterium RIFOXYA12_FULL_38_20]HBS88970.1 potassium transporter [Bacteroidales bacterium]
MKINYQNIFFVLSRIFLIEVFAVLSCIIIALIYNEPITPFVYTSAILLALTAALMHFTRTYKVEKIYVRDAYLTVTLAWLFTAVAGALPYLFSGSIPSFTDAFFESSSGFTTTGSSILKDIEILPKSILFWRSMTHWVGGIGIVVLVIVIVPSLNIGGQSLFSLESSFQEKIHARTKTVARSLVLIYVGLTVLQIILLMAGNMNWYESICHAFGTVATGGFSPKNSSFIEYSPYLQYVTAIFMLLAATNFVIHFYFVTGDFRKIKQNDEWKFFITFVLAVTLIVTFILYQNREFGLEKSFRDAFFQVISIISCTGFVSDDYMLWPTTGLLIIFFIMFAGGSVGSTSGGIKMLRHMILVRGLKKQFNKLMNPHSVNPVKVNGKALSSNTTQAVYTFIVWYFLVFLAGTMLMVAIGTNIQTSASSVATTMAGIGPGLGSVGAVSNFSEIPEAGKILLAFLMIIGRLELYTFLAIFSRSFRNK